MAVIPLMPPLGPHQGQAKVVRAERKGRNDRRVEDVLKAGAEAEALGWEHRAGRVIEERIRGEGLTVWRVEGEGGEERSRRGGKDEVAGAS